jgi:hypothetical protein
MIMGKKANIFNSSAIQAVNQEAAEKISNKLLKRTKKGKIKFKR